MGEQPSTDTDTAGKVYAELIQAEVSQENERQASIDHRGLAVISTSGLLASLILGFALPKNLELGSLSSSARILLSTGLIMLLVAATLGLFINVPTRADPKKSGYVGMDIPSLRMELEKNWNAPSDAVRRQVTETRLDILEKASVVNDRKAKRLRGSFLAEGAGVALIAASVADLFV